MYKYMLLIQTIMLTVAFIVILLYEHDILSGDKWYNFSKFLLNMCIMLTIITGIIMTIELFIGG